MTQPPIVFIHVPKTGGSSLYTMLLESIDIGATRSFLGDDAIDRARAAGWDDCLIASGHFDFDKAASVGKPLRLLTMLRAPVERALSLYWYSRSTTAQVAERIGCPMTNFARASEPERFFFDAPPRVRKDFTDRATRQLVGETAFQLLSGHPAGRGELVALARRRLDDMTAFGIMERFEASAQLIFETLGTPLLHVREINRLTDRMDHGAADRVEVAPPSAALRAYLEECNQLDNAVYDHAAELLSVRLAAAT